MGMKVFIHPCLRSWSNSYYLLFSFYCVLWEPLPATWPPTAQRWAELKMWWRHQTWQQRSELMPVDLPLGVTVIPLSCEAKSLVDNRKVSLAGGVRIISETPACLNNAFRAGQKNMSFPARNTHKISSLSTLYWTLMFPVLGGGGGEERNCCTSL